MRVLAMAHQWIPYHNAGAEVMLHTMLAALVQRGHQVDVTLSRQHDVSYWLDGVHIWPGRNPRELLDGADVIVTHLEQTPVASMLGRWHGIPVVHVLHNTMPVTREAVVSGTPALVVANSEWMLADYRKHIDAMPPAIVCRPPVCAADYGTVPGDRITLVNLRRTEKAPSGDLAMGKGSELFWTLARELPEMDFLGVRGGYGIQDIRWLPNVDVLDHVRHSEMRDLVYARTRVLIMPSSYESWGRTAVEAMASGIPVVAHPTPGLVEACAYAGLYADRSDIRGWTGILRDLSDPGFYTERSALARERALELDPTDDLNQWCDAVEAAARISIGAG